MRVSDINTNTRYVGIAGEFRVTSVSHLSADTARVELTPQNGGTAVSTVVHSTLYGRWIA